MFRQANWNRHKPAILALPAGRDLTRDDLLTGAFLIGRYGRAEMYYAPHNEYVNPAAKVLIVGITPGWTQMKTAFETARDGLAEGLSDEEAAIRTKRAARFAGAMRRHLIGMLEALELHRYLDIPNAAALFEERQALLHTTSLLRYPVFVNGRNYTGSQPKLTASPGLLDAALRYTKEDMAVMRKPLIIPLGRAVESVLDVLEREGIVQGTQRLRGFPHPSGANGHRHAQFEANADGMRQALDRFFIG